MWGGRRLTVRMPTEFYEELKTLAAQRARSIGWTLVELAKQGLSAEDRRRLRRKMSKRRRA
jgi:predicted DNA-binding ribbon-helix-helix protein